jgi:predicted transcriptional regulator
MKTLIIGIASYEQMKERTMQIARGKYKPKKGEPKLWFTSVESFAKILSNHNRELLALIREHQPQSLIELAELSGREKSNLSRTLKTMNHYGLVNLKTDSKGKLVPKVPYSHIKLDMDIGVHA